MTRLRDKIFAMTLGCLIATALLLSYFAIYFLRTSLEDELNLRSLFLMRSFQMIASESLRKSDSQSLEGYLDSLLGDADLEEARLMDPSGTESVASKSRDSSNKAFVPNQDYLSKA